MHRITTSGLVALATVLGIAASGSAASASAAPPVAARGLLPAAAFLLPAAAFPLPAAAVRLPAAAVRLPAAAVRLPAAAFPLARPGHVRTAITVPANELADVSCVSAKYCVAVGINANGNGGNGSPLAETWNGSAWKTTAGVKLPSGASGGGLSGVSCKSATYCVVVGSYLKGSNGYVLAETWNGKTWTLAQPAAPGGAALSRVSCATTKSCLAVGQYTTNNGNGTAALAEYWNGTKWAQEKPAAPSGNGVMTGLTGVSCVSATYCVTVGMSLGATGISQSTESLLAYSWNGRAFAKLKAPAVPSGTFLAEPTDVSCSSATNCVAVGLNLAPSGSSFSSTALAESWNGKGWTAAKVPWPKGTTNEALVGAWCASATSCVAVGVTGLNMTSTSTGASGRAAAVSFNGKAWSAATVPAPAKGKASIFGGATCLSTTYCVAVGAQGSTSSANSNGLSGFWNGKSWKLITAI